MVVGCILRKADPSNYDFVNAVQPSMLSSASHVSKEEPVFYSNSGNWAQAAPVESPASPSHATALDSTSRKVNAQPARFQPGKKVPQLPSTQQLEMPQKVSKLFPSTYIVQSKGGYRRGKKVSSKTRYSSSVSPPPPFGLKGPSGVKW
ncbi:unnamed protein product [Merluccius merluccius]